MSDSLLTDVLTGVSPVPLEVDVAVVVSVVVVVIVVVVVDAVAVVVVVVDVVVDDDDDGRMLGKVRATYLQVNWHTIFKSLNNRSF